MFKLQKIKLKITMAINMVIIMLLGKQLNIIHVVEYPKCGGTWVSNILRTYLNTDVRKGTTSLVRKNSVVQSHSLYRWYFRKNVVVYRDPRDVFTSFYYHELFFKDKKSLPLFKTLYGFQQNDSDENNFLRYLEQKLLSPKNTIPYFSYQDFYNNWESKHKITTKYEDLKQDTYKEIEKILSHLDIPINKKQLVDSIEQNTFARIANRKTGQEDKYSHARKGIVGDWTSIFNGASLDLIQKKYKKLFIQLDYEDINS